MNETTNLKVTKSSRQGQDDGRVIGLVVAASTNNVIGKNNHLVWNLPNDLKFFKNTTWGFPVIMGRKTFAEVNKPLPGRINIVITRKADWKAEGAIAAPDLEDAIHKAAETNAKQIFIIGGGEIYKQSMPIADLIYLTRVHAVVDGDTFFPVIDENIWELISNEDFPTDEKHAYAYSFQVWKKK
ncbi:MAG: dihydrofolate reductase [Ferruginibacter sp.]|nr:dihydrofolate reductase [Ferruginibacter sp.]